MEKKQNNFFPRFVSIEMVAILDLIALAKVGTTLMGRVLLGKLFCSLFNPFISLYIYSDQCEKF